MNAVSLAFLLISFHIFASVDSRRSVGGGSRRSSGSSRTYSRVVPTTKTNVNTQSGSNYYGNNYNSNTQRKSSNVATTPRYVMHTQATVKHYPQQVTQRTVYQQQGYTQRPAHQQPVYTQRPAYTQKTAYTQRPAYTQKPVYPQQASYPKQNYPTSHNQPGYGGSYGGGYGGNYGGGNYGGSSWNSPGGYYKKKDHGVRNAVLAGLGGSALGMYLGYKLGGLTHSMNNPNYGGYGGYGGYAGGAGAAAPMPPYSVVHHYHHGDKPIIQNAVVEQNVIAPCQDVNMCTPNTTPLCMTNGTIFCVTPIDQTSICNVNSTQLHCVNATITAPCLNDTDGNCNSTELATENLEIPCVSSINVFGDFSTNKLTVHAANGTTGTDTLTNQGISNKYCVTIIAEPLVEPQDLTNDQYVRYLQENPYAKEEADMKVGEIMNSIGGFMLF